MKNSKEFNITTPFGPPSDVITIGELAGKQIVTSTEAGRDSGVPSGTVRQVLHGCRQLVL